MNIGEMLSEARDSMTVKRVFGDPYEKDGLAVIPAAWVAGGGGGGADNEGSEGGGFGLVAFPAGAYIVNRGEVTWRPALNLNLVIVVSLLTFRTLLRVRAKRRRR
jgi:hypothetical protein